MQNLFEQIISEDNVRLAIKLTLNEISKSMFVNPIQIEHCQAHQEEYIHTTRKRLEDYQNYASHVSIRALKRKNEFALRNFIIPNIEDDIARMSVVLPIANELESKLIANCFANRRGEQITKNKSLTESFVEFGWKRFCDWQAVAVKKYDLLLKTDVSSFFDSICHDHLINAIIREFEVPLNDPLVSLLRNLFKVKHVYSVKDKPKEVIHGITIGHLGNHIFANVLLNEIDIHMSSFPRIEYGRYVDDIRIFGNDKSVIKSALNSLQMKLYDIGLNLNGAKTKFAGEKKFLDRLLSEKFFSYMDEEYLSNYKAPSPQKINRIYDDIQKYQISKEKDINKSLNTENTDLNMLHRTRMMNRPNLKKDYLHAVYYALKNEPSKIDHHVVKRLIHFICVDPENEKFACWLISWIILAPEISIVKRKKFLKKTLELMLSKKATSYAIYRILYILSNHKKYLNLDYSVVNNSLCTELKDEFKKLVWFCMTNNRLILNLIGLFALKAYNDNHTKEFRIRMSVKRSKPENSVLDENKRLIKNIPNLVRGNETEFIVSPVIELID